MAASLQRLQTFINYMQLSPNQLNTFSITILHCVHFTTKMCWHTQRHLPLRRSTRMLYAYSNLKLPRFSNHPNQKPSGFDAVLDVGGVYDPSYGWFDHHQKGFDEVLGDGFALVYKHYGVEIIAKTTQLDEQHPDVHRLFSAVYKNFIEAVDAMTMESISMRLISS